MGAKKKANHTFLDGTVKCPICNSAMTRFHFTKNAVSNANVKTDWAQWKKVTTWTETTYAEGIGTMCLHCYRKRQVWFWVGFGLVLLAIAALILFGALYKIQPMLFIGVGAFVLCILFAGSKSAKKLYDIWGMMSRKSNAAQEFACLLLQEHGEQFGANNVVHVTKEE